MTLRRRICTKCGDRYLGGEDSDGQCQVCSGNIPDKSAQYAAEAEARRNAAPTKAKAPQTVSMKRLIAEGEANKSASKKTAKPKPKTKGSNNASSS